METNLNGYVPLRSIKILEGIEAKLVKVFGPAKYRGINSSIDVDKIISQIDEGYDIVFTVSE